MDETHTIATPGMGREDLYVAMSRGRHVNRVYTVVEDQASECLPGAEPSSARAVLEQILATSHAEPSATESWETWHPAQPSPVVPPWRPQQPWTRARPQPAPTLSTNHPAPSADGPVLSR